MLPCQPYETAKKLSCRWLHPFAKATAGRVPPSLRRIPGPGNPGKLLSLQHLYMGFCREFSLFVYQLVLVALPWPLPVLHGVWPSDRAAACPTTPPSTFPSRKRRRGPKPFADARKAHCDAVRPPVPLYAPSTPPPRIVDPRRRRAGATTHFCPNPDCPYRGWAGWGTPRQRPSQGGRWRQRLCIVCRGYFLETLGTIFPGKQVAPEADGAGDQDLAEGLGIRGMRVFEVDPHTVLVVGRSAGAAQAFSRHVLHDMRVRRSSSMHSLPCSARSRTMK